MRVAGDERLICTSECDSVCRRLAGMECQELLREEEGQCIWVVFSIVRFKWKVKVAGAQGNSPHFHARFLHMPTAFRSHALGEHLIAVSNKRRYLFDIS